MNKFETFVLTAFVVCAVINYFYEPVSAVAMQDAMRGTTYRHDEVVMNVGVESSEATVTLQVGYSNTPVPLVKWAGTLATAGRNHRYRGRREVDYMPTALTLDAAEPRRLYVAGWIEASQRSIVEEWTFGELPVTESEGEADDILFGRLPITVRLLHRSDPETLGPAWSLASYPEADDVLYLECSSTGSSVIKAIDRKKGSITTTFDPSLYPVGHMRSIWSARTPDRGRVIVASRRFPFSHPGDVGGSSFVMTDPDRDGDLDTATTVAAHHVPITYPDPWERDA